MLVPSGLHAGAAVSPLSNENWTWFEPFAFIVHTWTLPVRSLVTPMLLAVADQGGVLVVPRVVSAAAPVRSPKSLR